MKNSKKRRLTRGETLTETLSAVLVISLASVALAAMISTASKMNIRAKAGDERLYQAITQLESSTEEPEAGSVTVTFTVDGGGTRSINFNVDFAKGGDGLIRSYEYGGGGA